jgi:hypothetical protein
MTSKSDWSRKEFEEYLNEMCVETYFRDELLDKFYSCFTGDKGKPCYSLLFQKKLGTAMRRNDPIMFNEEYNRINQ